jgi:predicted DNA-binding transcriptional regulator YafY/general stress protein 26
MKLDRLLGILVVLMQNDRVTAPYLSQKFEVTRRTIGRDIDALCQAGIPVVTRQGAGGGISIAEGFKLDKSVLTTDELSGIIAALRGLGSVSGTSQMERTLDKLGAGKDAVVSLKEPVVIDLAAHHKTSLTEKIAGLKRAIGERRLVEFDYYYEKGRTRRRVEPCLILFQWTAWYLFGFCRERADFRMFKLARLWDLEVCEETFAPREIPPERCDFGAFLHDDEKLVALFEPSAQYRLIEEYGLGCYAVTEDGRLRLEIGFTNRDFIVQWLLGFGEKVRVLEPSSVAEALRQTAKKMLEAYGEQDALMSGLARYDGRNETMEAKQMDSQMLEKAAKIIETNTAHRSPEGAEPYCVLALIDENGTPTASAVTASKAEGLEWITFCTGLQSNKTKRAARCDRASVCFCAADYNITLTGRMEIVTDEAVKREMWYDGLQNHFQGPDDPGYCVLRFHAERYNLLVDWQEARGSL